jgi:hypothetical protein
MEVSGGGGWNRTIIHPVTSIWRLAHFELHPYKIYLVEKTGIEPYTFGAKMADALHELQLVIWWNRQDSNL